MNETPDPAQTDAVAPAAETVSSAPPSLATQLAELQARHTEASDAYLRAKAEAENTRRRADEEVSKARKFAIESFADSLLPVKDSLEAAIAMPDAPVAQVLEGVHATLRQLTAALERQRRRPGSTGRLSAAPGPALQDRRACNRCEQPP